MSVGQPLLENDPGLVPFTEETEQQRTAFTRIITTIHDFIIFLRDLYLPEQAVLVPPEGGWPEITKESWSSLGKGDEVIEVLRHLTYIERYKTGDKYEFLQDSGLEDYRSPYNVKKVKKGHGREVIFMTEIPYEPAPADVIGLVGGGRYAQRILCDCREGTVYGQGCAGLSWVEGERQPIEQYFATVKAQFRTMKLLPINQREVRQEEIGPETIYTSLKEIYQKHGWPDNYDKTACVAEVAGFQRSRKYLEHYGLG